MNRDDVDRSAAELLLANKRQSRLLAAYLYAIQVCNHVIASDTEPSVSLGSWKCLVIYSIQRICIVSCVHRGTIHPAKSLFRTL